MRVGYFWSAAIAGALAIVASAFWPIVRGWEPLAPITDMALKNSLLAAIVVFVIIINGLVFFDGLKRRGHVAFITIAKQIMGQLAWLAGSVLIIFQIVTGRYIQTMTIPLMLLGMMALLLSMGMMKPFDQQMRPSSAQKNFVKKLSHTGLVLAVFTFVFWSWYENIATGLTLMVSVLILVDAKWPVYLAEWRQLGMLSQLRADNIFVPDTKTLNRLDRVTHVVVDKAFVLTDPADVRPVRAFSINQAVSAADLMSVMYALLREHPSGQSIGELLTLTMQDGFIRLGEEKDATILAVPAYAKRQAALSETEITARLDEGYGVLYLICNGIVAGGLYYEEKMPYALSALNDIAKQYYLCVSVLTAEPACVVERWQEEGGRLSFEEVDCLLEERQRIRNDQLRRAETLYITARPGDESIAPSLLMTVGSRSGDVSITQVDQLGDLFDTTRQIRRINYIYLFIWGAMAMLAWVLAMGMQSLLLPFWFVPPIIAVVFRLIMTALVAAMLNSERPTTTEVAH